jgi:hypothetical protein
VRNEQRSGGGDLNGNKSKGHVNVSYNLTGARSLLIVSRRWMIQCTLFPYITRMQHKGVATGASAA